MTWHPNDATDTCKSEAMWSLFPFFSSTERRGFLLRSNFPITLHGATRSPAPPLAAALHRSGIVAGGPHSLHLWLLCCHPRGHLQELLLSFRARSASGNFTPFPIHLPMLYPIFDFAFVSWFCGRSLCSEVDLRGFWRSTRESLPVTSRLSYWSF